MDAWGEIALTAVAANGNLTQLYPTFCTVGTGATTMGTLVRSPSEGVCIDINVETDFAHGGDIELWDINGAEVGADVNTVAAITNAQLLTAIAAGKAKLMWSQTFSGSSGASKADTRGMPFSKGLAARFITSSPSGEGCYVNLVCDGGFKKNQICG